MELSRLTGGGTPLVMNVAVQAAAAIGDGVPVVISVTTTTAFGATVTATSTSAAGAGALGVTQEGSDRAALSPENTNGLGVTRYNIGTDGIPDTSAVTGSAWLPTCINPDALYFARCTETTAVNGAINKSITASTGTTVTVASSGVDGRIGGWLMDGRTGALSSAGGAPTFNGQLRAVTATAASTIFAIATAMNVSTDSNIVFVAGQGRKNVELAAGAQELASSSATTAMLLATNFLIVDNLVSHAAAPMHPLRFWADDGLNGLTNNSLYHELALAGHATVTQAAAA
jgi:hypothetical protein